MRRGKTQHDAVAKARAKWIAQYDAVNHLERKLREARAREEALYQALEAAQAMTKGGMK